MRISLLSQSLGLGFWLRRSSGLGRAAGGHARVMHTLLGTGGRQGLVEGADCLVAAGDGTAGYTDVAETVRLWKNGGVGLR